MYMSFDAIDKGWNGHTGRVGYTEIEHLPVFDERVEGLHELRHGSRVVPSVIGVLDVSSYWPFWERYEQMDVKDVDVIRLQLLQAVFDGEIEALFMISLVVDLRSDHGQIHSKVHTANRADAP